MTKLLRASLIHCLLFGHITGFAITVDQLDANLGVEVVIFNQDGISSAQEYQSNLSIFFQSDFVWSWNQNSDRLSFVPYLRIDQQDHARSHSDIREFLWTHLHRDWHLKVGLGKVFWGVTEFNHLVDVINQTDLVESIDGEEKLGQPMINLSMMKDWGLLDLYVLPGFRERTFPGKEGRLRAQVTVDPDRVYYESIDGDQHIDFAIRWSETFRYFDLGAYVFDGTNREPLFDIQPTMYPAQNADYVAIANYLQMKQFGVDFQAVVNNWLFKLEALWRETLQNQYTAAQLGIEYTFYNALGRQADLGILLEYGWDERGIESSSIIQNDLFIGGRVTLNDFESSELLFGLAYDQDYHSHSAFIEFSQSTSQNTQLSLEARSFKAKNPQDYLYNIAGDDYIQLTFEHFF